MKARKPVNPMSSEMKVSRAIYSKEVARWKIGRRCVKCGQWRLLTCHHWKGRVGRLLLDQRFWVPLCFPCHQWVDNNKGEARNLNFLAPFGLYNEQEDKGIIGLRFTPCGVELVRG
jgi:hypothetical protein